MRDILSFLQVFRVPQNWRVTGCNQGRNGLVLGVKISPKFLIYIFT